MMERTLKITVKGTRSAMQSVNRRMILDIFKESDVLAIWTMERQDIWYFTFEERFKVDEFDWQIMNSKSVGLTLMFAACDRVVKRAKVHWLPIWVTNEEVNQVFAAQGDIKSINHVMDNSVATGIKEVVFSMQKGKRKHLLYLTSVHGHRCLLYVPGRPSICFKFNIPRDKCLIHYTYEHIRIK